MDALPRAVIRSSPADFVVVELPAYAPSGRGEHLYVTFRKTGRTTPDAVRDIARALDLDPRSAGWAGMKDRHAVTTQTASFLLPLARDPAEAMRLSLPGIEVLEATRHDNRLKPGHLEGNRFHIRLRSLEPGAATAVRERLEGLARTGVPNAFGPQRFGRDGDNPARALDWLAGRAPGPRDKNARRLLFSALQSWMFNRVLDARVADGTWATVLEGDVAKKHDSGGLFTVSAADLEDAVARAAAGALSATGPMFGLKMRWPEGAPLALEERVLEQALGVTAAASRTAGAPPAAPVPGSADVSGSAPDATPRDLLARARSAGEGTRRPLRMMVSELAVTCSDGDAGSLEVSFVLPKGGYATTVLGSACHWVDAAAPGGGGTDARNNEGDPVLELPQGSDGAPET
jgi:tRNA pseudouridine13 synthase